MGNNYCPVDSDNDWVIHELSCYESRSGMLKGGGCIHKLPHVPLVGVGYDACQNTISDCHHYNKVTHCPLKGVGGFVYPIADMWQAQFFGQNLSDFHNLYPLLLGNQGAAIILFIGNTITFTQGSAKSWSLTCCRPTHFKCQPMTLADLMSE